jgi:tetratricopeptide (TPR) repeat protein
LRRAQVASERVLFFCRKLVYIIVMFIRILLAFTLFIAPVHAAQSSSTVEIAPATPVDPVKKRADDVDKLFGELHKNNPATTQNTIEKIWALWTRNDSATAEVLLKQSGKALEDGAFETSETMLNELLGSYPDYTEALNQRALLYYNMKRYDDALFDIEAVLEQEPRHFGALSGLAAIYQAKGDVAKAAAALRDAIAVNPQLQTAKDVLQQLEHDYPNI